MVITLFLLSALATFIYMTGVYIIALIKRDNSIVDVAWGIGFIITYCVTFINGYHTLRAILAGVLVIIWGLRLSLHIFMRNRGKGEDHRYAAWRKQWHWVKLRSFFQVFMLQGAVLLVVVSPIILICASPAPTQLIWIDYAGLAVWIFGFCFEAIGDYQLRRFLQNPTNKGRICMIGLWRYTRHPNYFGEATMWWGIWLIACAVPYGWLTILSPITITLLLRYVSGVPMLEAQWANNKEFQAYARRTSAMLPWKVTRTA